MRLFFLLVGVGSLLVVNTPEALAQPAATTGATEALTVLPQQLEKQLEAQQAQIETLTKTVQRLAEQVRQSPESSPPPVLAVPYLDLPANPIPTPTEQELQKTQLTLAALREQAKTAPPAPTVERLQKQLDLQRKQIEVLEKMIKLLATQLEKAPVLAKMQVDLATLEARSKQAAQRDQELANGIDDLNERFDASQRYGPAYPAPLKKLFLASGTNETPLSIYGALAFGYSKIIGNSATAGNGVGRPPTPGGFYFGEFTPDFLLKLNDWVFLSAEVGVGPDGSVSAGSFAEADFFVTNWLTVTAGRFVAPIGWFNLRLNNPWINKLPADAPGSGPLLWQQVLPTLSLLGVQASGAFYLGNSPFKMEYSAYVSNGLNLTPATPGAPTLSELANLENMTNTFNVISNEKAAGGRLGLWWPEKGLEAGISTLYSGDYLSGGFENAINFWAADFNYRRGDWDFRAEYGRAFQQAGNFTGAPIRREGFYAQLAYRPWQTRFRYLANTELVYRYGYVTFPGIDVHQLDLTTFSTPVDVPTRRQQNEIGINYYFYASLVLKVAYQINDEPKFHLNDNQFLTELAWGW